MSKAKFTIGLTDKDQANFSKCLYTAFKKLPSSWIMNNYTFHSKTESIEPGVTHYIYRSYLQKNDKGVVAGCAFNLNSTREMQFEKMGFKLRGGKTDAMFECTAFFRLQKQNPLSTFTAFHDVYINHLKLGYHTGIATCADNILKHNIALGGRVVDTITLNGRTLYLLVFDLKSPKAEQLGLI